MTPPVFLVDNRGPLHQLCIKFSLSSLILKSKEWSALIAAKHTMLIMLILCLYIVDNMSIIS